MSHTPKYKHFFAEILSESSIFAAVNSLFHNKT